jgi:hypothetical protein
MRLIAEIGYRHVVFAKDCDYAAVIEAFGKATVCESSGYGAEQMYVPATDGGIKVELAQDSAVKVAGESGDQSALLDKLVALTKQNAELATKVYVLEAQAKKVAEAVSK